VTKTLQDHKTAQQFTGFRTPRQEPDVTAAVREPR
jgi:hypothetical protein